MKKIHQLLIVLFAAISVGCTSTPKEGTREYEISVNNYISELYSLPDTTLCAVRYPGTANHWTWTGSGSGYEKASHAVRQKIDVAVTNILLERKLINRNHIVLMSSKTFKIGYPACVMLSVMGEPTDVNRTVYGNSKSNSVCVRKLSQYYLC